MNVCEIKVYKSPRRKLVRFFERSRDQWKAKCKEAKTTVKQLNNRVRYLEKNKAVWKTKALELEQELVQMKTRENRVPESDKVKKNELSEPVVSLDSFKQIPRYHHYSIGHIWLFVTLVLSAVTTLRSASRTIACVTPLFHPSLPCPSWYAGRFWLLRIGYYKLMRPKQQAKDWVWIIDHTVQSGVEKCLLVLGVRLSDLKASNFILKHEDVEPIALYPVKSSTGAIVYQQLEDTIEKTGVPRAILADHGSDVKSGIEQFLDIHPETCYLYDIKHKTAILLKQHLQYDETWKQFTQRAAQTKSQVQQTLIAFMAPPNQRTKARYMNLEVLIRWAQRALALLDHVERRTDKKASHEQIKTKLGWLTAFRDPLKEWEALCIVATTVEQFVRKQGLWNGCERYLLQDVGTHELPPKADVLRAQLLDFVKEESSKAHPDERLPGSSEIIESVFGKLKRLEQNQSKSGFTLMVLSVAAIVSETTQDTVKQALETVPTKRILEWAKETLGQSVQAKRKIAFSTAPGAEQKWDQLLDAL